MNALDLNVENRIDSDIRIVFLLDIVSQNFLAGFLHLRQLIQEGAVAGNGLQADELGRFKTPFVADRFVDEVRQLRIGFDKPAAVRNAVGLVGETVRENRVELMERRILQDLRVDFRNAVDAVAAQYGQMSHVNLTVPKDGYAAGFVFVARIEAAHFLEPAVVDFFDDEINARQERLEHGDRPFFHGFRQNRVVRIGHGTARNIPCVFPGHAFLVEEDAHQFRHDQSRMGVVDVDGDVLVELVHAFLVFSLIVTYDALQACRNHEVFLHQAQAAAIFRAVFRIEEAGNELYVVLVAERPVAVAEGQLAVQVFPGVFGPPQAQRIDGVVMIANDRNVVRDGADRRIIFVNAFELSVFRRPHVGVAAEADVYGLIYSLDFPGIAVDQPVVRKLYLLAVDDALVEQPVLVADAASVSRQLQRRQGVDEAGCQTA